MQISLTKSPFNSHDNIIFDFIKKNLVDDKIYNSTKYSYPFTKVKTKYQITLTGCEEYVKIYFNDSLYLEFYGGVGNSEFPFYVLPVFDENKIDVKDINGNLKATYKFDCYNFQIFLAETARHFKVLWNKLFEAQANTYYTENLIKDLDEEYLIPEDRYTRAVGKLLGTERYSKLSDSEYFNFLHNVFDMHLNAGTFEGYYQIQQALSNYIDKIDLINLEKYIPFKNDLYGKVFYDTTASKYVKIYPTYIDIGNEWGIINYTSFSPNTIKLNGYIYVDGEIDSTGNNINGLKIKYTENQEFFKHEIIKVDTFVREDIYNDEDGFYTGFENGKFVILRNPLIDGTISVTNVGNINISNSAYLTDSEFNLVSLGTRYKDEIESIDISYKTFEIPKILGQIGLDSTSQKNIKKIKLSGHSDTDASYLSYKENNYGSVVIVVRASQIIDNELKQILNKLIRDVLPIHITYYLIISTIGIWDTWGDEDFTFLSHFGDGTNTGLYPTIIFKDLK